MTSDPHGESGANPGAEDVAAVYAFLGRASDDLLAGLDRVLPVESAISATIGPDSQVPKAPPRSRKARRARRIRRWVRRPSTG